MEYLLAFIYITGVVGIPLCILYVIISEINYRYGKWKFNKEYKSLLKNNKPNYKFIRWI